MVTRQHLVIHLLPWVGKGLFVALLPPQLLLLLCPKVLTPHILCVLLLPSTDELIYLHKCRQVPSYTNTLVYKYRCTHHYIAENTGVPSLHSCRCTLLTSRIQVHIYMHAYTCIVYRSTYTCTHAQYSIQVHIYMHMYSKKKKNTPGDPRARWPHPNPCSTASGRWTWPTRTPSRS